MNLRQILAHAQDASKSSAEAGTPAGGPGGNPPSTPQIYVQGAAVLMEVCIFILAGRACTAFATMMLQPVKNLGVMTFANEVDFTSDGTRYLGWGYSLIDPDQGPMAFFFGNEPIGPGGTFPFIAADTAHPYGPGDPPPWEPQNAIYAYRFSA